MFNFIIFFLFSTVSTVTDHVMRMTVVIEEIANNSVPQMQLRVIRESISGEPRGKTLMSFATVDSLLQIFLYPGLGYGELFRLLDMERDPFAVYKFQKLMIQILVDRINNDCIESNSELCRYLLSRYNTCCFESTFIEKLREWREELKSRHDTVENVLEQKSSPKKVVPPLSKQGKSYLQSKSGVRDHVLSEKEFSEEYMKLPEPLRCSVCLEGGGRTGFDACLDQLFGVSLCSVVTQNQSRLGRPPKLIDTAAPVIIAALQAGEPRRTIGGWFDVSSSAVSKWIQRKFGPEDKQMLLERKK